MRKIDQLADQWTHGSDGAYGRLCDAIENGYRIDARDRAAIAVLLREYERTARKAADPND